MVAHRDQPSHRNMTMRGLVGSLPDAEPGMALQGVDDLVQQRLPRQVVVNAGEGEPELQAVLRRRIELLRN